MSTIEGFLQQAPNQRYYIHCYDKEAAGNFDIELTSGKVVEICRPDESYLRGRVEFNQAHYGGYYFFPSEKGVAPFALQEGFEARIRLESTD